MSDIIGISILLLLGTGVLYLADERPLRRRRDQDEIAITALGIINAAGSPHARRGPVEAAADHITYLGRVRLTDLEVTQELLTGVPRPGPRVAPGLPSGPSSPPAVTPPSAAGGDIQRHGVVLP